MDLTQIRGALPKEMWRLVTQQHRDTHMSFKLFMREWFDWSLDGDGLFFDEARYSREAVKYVAKTLINSPPGFKLDVPNDAPKFDVYLTCENVGNALVYGYSWRLWVVNRQKADAPSTGFVEWRVVYRTHEKIWSVETEDNLSGKNDRVLTLTASCLNIDLPYTDWRKNITKLICTIMKKLISYTITIARQRGVDTNAEIKVAGSEIRFRDQVIWKDAAAEFSDDEEMPDA